MAVKEHKKPSVEINNLRFTYPGIDGHPPPGSTPLIDDFSLTLYPGDRCLLVGSNGAGKTTILKILGGKNMVEPDMVRVLGRSAFHDTALTASGDLSYLGGEWRREVAFAGFEVPIQMDVSAEKMIFGVSGTDPKGRDELIKVLGIDLSWRMHKSSDGQRRRVQICIGFLKSFKGLIKANSMYPLVVAILPDVPEEHRMLLRRYGCLVREIEPLAPSLQSSDKYARSYYVLNYSKLRIWQFVEYSKMVYLDGDMQVFENIDHLFELPDKYFYAVADCVCDMYGECCPEVLPWPKVLGPRPSIYFNAGMFVFQPNLSIYVRLLNTLKVTPPTQFAEQDFLNMYFKDKYKSIPYVYNLLLAMLWHHPEKVEVNKAKAVHYCFPGAKPWKYTGKEERMDREDIKMLVKKWWDIYNDTTLDHKAQGSGVDAHRFEGNCVF